MNIWASLLPEQRTVQPRRRKQRAKPQEITREQRMNDAALRSEQSRTRREIHQAEITLLMAIANGKPSPIKQGEALEQKRIELGLRPCEFAAILGISRPFYCDVKAGRRSLYLPAARRAYALGVDAVACLAPDADLTRSRT